MIDGEMDLFMNQCIDKIIYTEGVGKYDCHLFTGNVGKNCNTVKHYPCMQFTYKNSLCVFDIFHSTHSSFMWQ